MLRLNLRSYLGFILIYTLLGIATVRERSETIALRYRLAKLLQTERQLDEDLTRAKILLARMSEPARLEKIIEKSRLPMLPLKELTAPTVRR